MPKSTLLTEGIEIGICEDAARTDDDGRLCYSR